MTVADSGTVFFLARLDASARVLIGHADCFEAWAIHGTYLAYTEQLAVATLEGDNPRRTMMSMEQSVHGAHAATLAPSKLGDYALLSKLASGGMATVYVARKSGAAGFERLVAIKCCHPHLRDNAEFSSMFLDEARLAAGIRHPNVVGTLDVGDGEALYLVMEYVEGCCLANLLRHAAELKLRIPPGIAVRIMIDTLQGLHAAHELRDKRGQFLNLVHRDVSPQNILVGVDGVARITDFGIAFATARSTRTQDGLIKGKFSYIAPEQVSNQPVTRRLDVFSAGSVLWEALTGRSLFRRRDDHATIQAVAHDQIPPPSSVVPELPAALDAVVLKALERDPDARYQTAADFADALERVALPRVSARSVGHFVQETFANELSERRDRLRSSPELAGELKRETPSGPRVSERAGITPTSRLGNRALPSELPPSMVVEREASGYPEHRRLRGILAAAMLLLVGTAVGVLIDRSSTRVHGTAASAPTSSAVIGSP